MHLIWWTWGALDVTPVEKYKFLRRIKRSTALSHNILRMNNLLGSPFGFATSLSESKSPPGLLSQGTLSVGLVKGLPREERLTSSSVVLR